MNDCDSNIDNHNYYWVVVGFQMKSTVVPSSGYQFGGEYSQVSSVSYMLGKCMQDCKSIEDI